MGAVSVYSYGCTHCGEKWRKEPRLSIPSRCKFGDKGGVFRRGEPLLEHGGETSEITAKEGGGI